MCDCLDGTDDEGAQMSPRRAVAAASRKAGREAMYFGNSEIIREVLSDIKHLRQPLFRPGPSCLPKGISGSALENILYLTRRASRT